MTAILQQILRTKIEAEARETDRALREILGKIGV